MNPAVWVENEWEAAGCSCSAGQEPTVWEGHSFRLHLRLMLLSAKILADCEALFGLQVLPLPPALPPSSTSPGPNPTPPSP